MGGDHQVFVGFYDIGGNAALCRADTLPMLAVGRWSSSSPSQLPARQIAARTGAVFSPTPAVNTMASNPPSAAPISGSLSAVFMLVHSLSRRQVCHSSYIPDWYVLVQIYEVQTTEEAAALARLGSTAGQRCRARLRTRRLGVADKPMRMRAL
jgi:hypothetical protein